jgi:hypothetical protein
MSTDTDPLRALEQRLGVRFPDDYRRFLAARCSFDAFVPPHGDYLQLTPAAELNDLNEAGAVGDRFPGAVAIGGDGSRELLAFDFRQDPPSLVLIDITAEGWHQAIPQAPTFTAFMDQFPRTGWIFDQPERGTDGA